MFSILLFALCYIWYVIHKNQSNKHLKTRPKKKKEKKTMIKETNNSNNNNRRREKKIHTLNICLKHWDHYIHNNIQTRMLNTQLSSVFFFLFLQLSGQPEATLYIHFVTTSNYWMSTKFGFNVFYLYIVIHWSCSFFIFFFLLFFIFRGSVYMSLMGRKYGCMMYYDRHMMNTTTKYKKEKLERSRKRATKNKSEKQRR